jgi:CRISPR-associated protein Cmr2
MSGHLLALSLGPVQEFIAAARRTRDLWFGSYVLSEVSRAAALAVADRAGVKALIFPAPETREELQGEGFVVANLILAELPAGAAPAAVAETAEQAARQRWRVFADEARRQAANLIRGEIWDDQVDDVLEFYAAWTPLGAPGDYRDCRGRVTRLLAGRKACRDFRPTRGPAGVPKSSLDGARESVLRHGARGSARLRLAEGEQLDVVGLTKRLAGGRQSYPSVARIAADPWLWGVAQSLGHSRALQQLRQECERLARQDIISRVEGDAFADFPYDGTTVFGNRHADIAAEAGAPREELGELTRIVRDLARSPGQGGFGEPNPYLAVLVADGDRMGAAIAAIPSAEEHRHFSRQLSQFAKDAHAIVQSERGVCVYAGGDDVLAFVPVDRCLRCAGQLHERFGELLRAKDGDPLTLSVGIAIGHFMEPLEDLRAYGQDAERLAKQANGPPGHARLGARDGLAVQVHPRGGVAFGVRERWQTGEASLDQRLARWARLFSERRLPGKLPYDLRELARAYETWTSPATLPWALAADTRLLLKRKQVRLDEVSRAWVEQRLSGLSGAVHVARLADEMLAAGWIAAAMTQAAGGRPAAGPVSAGATA